MTKRWAFCIVTGLALLCAVAATGWASGDDEERVTIDQVPAAVRATILKEAKGGTIKEIERETENGKTIYEAEIIIDGKEVEIEVAVDGTLLGREIEEADDDDDDDEDDDEDDDDEATALDRIPAKAREALLKHAKGAKITEVEREKVHGVVFYEAEWTVDGREHEAKVTADGALVELEEEVDAKDVPVAVRKAAAKAFPKKAKLTFERKMIVIYEVEAKVDGKEREVLILPSGEIHGDHDHDDHDDDHDDDDHGRKHDNPGH